MKTIEFLNLQGSISSVPIEAYDRITQRYLEKVAGIDAIIGIVKIGSVSCPGLSDIDIFVILDESKPAPAWHEISIRDVANNDPHGSIIAHDVFVVPSTIADRIGGFFYVDNQTVLRGRGFSDISTSAVSPHMLDLITLEYTCHRLESLFHLLTLSATPLRAALLLISTLRHTADLACELGIFGEDEARLLKQEIEDLRLSCVDREDCGAILEGWASRVFQLLWPIVTRLGTKVNATSDNHSLNPRWSAGAKLSFIDVMSDTPPLELWSNFVTAHRDSRLGKRVKAIPMPVQFHEHVAGYLAVDSSDAKFFSANFPEVGKNDSGEHSLQEAKALRMELILQHWKFIEKNDYQGCSGKGYFGLNMQSNHGLKRSLLQLANKINARILSRHA